LFSSRKPGSTSIATRVPPALTGFTHPNTRPQVRPPRTQFCAARNVLHFEDFGDSRFDRAHGDAQPFGNRFCRFAREQQIEHFAPLQAEVVASPWTAAARVRERGATRVADRTEL